jgi:hypothetical protein
MQNGKTENNLTAFRGWGRRGGILMQRESNQEYYARRERDERRLAENAASPDVKAAHMRLANEYRQIIERAGNSDPRATLHMVQR